MTRRLDAQPVPRRAARRRSSEIVTSPAFQVPPTAQQAVLGELRRGLRQGELKPGTKIYQEELAERLGMSRVPVREALKILEGEGRVVYTAHRGYVVTELSYEELAEIYRMRELLETEAVRAAIPKFTDADLTAVREAMAEMEAASLVSEVVSANRTYHFALFEASGMKRLTAVIHQLWDAMEPYRVLYVHTGRATAAMKRQHRAVIAAIAARDTEKVIELLDHQRDDVIQDLQKVLGRRTPDATD